MASLRAKLALVTTTLVGGVGLVAAAAGLLLPTGHASSAAEAENETSTAAVGEAGPRTAATEVASPSDGDAADILRAEIGAMLAGGLAPDDPKVAPLLEDLAALEAAATTPPPGEPGVDLTEVLGTPPGGGARSASPAATAVAWDRGAVDCEPLPTGTLTVDELAGNRCVVAPQPDGTSRYVAVAPDGTVRVVRFGTDGSVTRSADRRMAAPGVALAGAELTVTERGDVVVNVAEAPAPAPTTIDLS